MANSAFFPSSADGWLNTRPNEPVQFSDINVNNILYVFATTFTNESGTVVPVFQMGVLEGGGTAVELSSSTYLFPTYGCSLAQFKTILDAQASTNDVVSYTNLFAIGNKENVISTRNVLIGDAHVVRRVYTPKGDYTVFYMNGLQNMGSYLQFYLSGDKSKAFAYYYAY